MVTSSSSLQKQIDSLKPSPALNVYNIFFLIERRRILENRSLSMAEIRQILVENRQHGGLKKKKKRVHRKTHGKVGFKDLTNQIASRWKAIDGATRHSLDQLAEYDKSHYRKQLKAWKELKKASKTMTTTMVASTSFQMVANPAGGHQGSPDDDSHGDGRLIKEEQHDMASPFDPIPHHVVFGSPEGKTTVLGEWDWSHCSMYLDAMANGVDLLSPMDNDEMDNIFSD